MCVYASTVKISEEESDVFLNMLSCRIVDTYERSYVYIIIISSISTYICVPIYSIYVWILRHTQNRRVCVWHRTWKNTFGIIIIIVRLYYNVIIFIYIYICVCVGFIILLLSHRLWSRLQPLPRARALHRTRKIIGVYYDRSAPRNTVNQKS